MPLSSARSRAASRPRQGVEHPRIATPPLRPLTPKTSLGFKFAEFAEQVVEIKLLPWQRWLAIHALELNPDGSFRFRTVVLLVARQNGKSTFLQLLALFFMYVESVSLVIGTAQNLDIAEEVWQGAVDIVEDIPELAALIEKVDRTNGKKALELKHGERYKVQAANRRGGRGLSGDVVMLDEVREHQSWDAWGAVTKTTMARPNAQVWAVSNAGDAASVVLRHLRKIAHVAIGDPDSLGEPVDAGPEDGDTLEADDSIAIFEWSAPPGCAADDREAWAQANPALGHTITERAILAALRTDPDWVFRTEVLCQWVDTSVDGPFPPGAWEATTDPVSAIPEGGKFVFGVDVSWDRGMAYIAAAGRRDDGMIHVEVVAQRAGTEWVAPWLSERKDTPGLSGLVFQSRGAPVSSMGDELEGTGIPPIEWGSSDLGVATGLFYDLVRVVQEDPAAGVRHRPQPVLDVAAATASMRPLGDAWAWDRKKSPNDIAPLVAVTAAAWALGEIPEKKVSVYESRGAVLI